MVCRPTFRGDKHVPGVIVYKSLVLLSYSSITTVYNSSLIIWILAVNCFKGQFDDLL